MHRWWCTGNEGHVVGASEAGHCAVGNARESFTHELFNVGEDAVLDALLDVGGVAAINANDHDGLLWPCVANAVQFKMVHGVRFKFRCSSVEREQR